MAFWPLMEDYMEVVEIAFEGHSGVAMQVAFSPDGELLVSTYIRRPISEALGSNHGCFAQRPRGSLRYGPGSGTLA